MTDKHHHTWNQKEAETAPKKGESDDEKEQERPNCYDCVHRGTIPGSAHSSCKHPTTDIARDNPMLEMMGIFASVGRVPPIQADVGLNIKGSAHGIKSGWFNWPYNFDPVWLDECDGFEVKIPPPNQEGG